jgi:hypothetical protein
MARLPHEAPPTPGPPATVAPNGNGNGNGASPPPGPGRSAVGDRLPGPSVRPALVVIGIAALVLLTGGIGAALTSSGSAVPAPTRSLKTAPGATITAVPGRSALKPIVSGGQPPDDILDAVAMPRGAVFTPGSATDNGIGLFDHSLSFTIAVPEERVIDFFRAEMKALKWQLVTQGPPPHGAKGYEVVAQHPSSDGYEWELGVTVAPTTFGSGTQAGAESTPFTLRLFAVTDDD